MLLSELFTKRGDLLEFAEVLGLSPDAPIPADCEAVVWLHYLLPQWEPRADWRTILTQRRDLLREIPPETCFVTVLDGRLVLFPGAFPCDFAGNVVKFTEGPVTTTVYHLGNYLRNRHGKRSEPETSPAQ